MTSDTAATAGSMRLMALLAVAGGFLDAFTFVGHGGVFANAQTGNMVLLAVLAADGAWAGAIRHLLPIVAFVIGVAVAETVFHPRVALRLRRPPRAALMLEIAVLAVVGALPGTFSDTVVILVVAFVSAFQTAAFGKLGEWSVSTTMTTGNLRVATSAAYHALVHHEPEASPQARAFGVVCVAFVLGAGLGALLTHRFGEHASWGACVLLSAGLLLFVVDERRPYARALVTPG
jgi:uncharacterized membrane protein YoaK (UPF0700 family)